MYIFPVLPLAVLTSFKLYICPKCSRYYLINYHSRTFFSWRASRKREEKRCCLENGESDKWLKERRNRAVTTLPDVKRATCLIEITRGNKRVNYRGNELDSIRDRTLFGMQRWSETRGLFFDEGGVGGGGGSGGNGGHGVNRGNEYTRLWFTSWERGSLLDLTEVRSEMSPLERIPDTLTFLRVKTGKTDHLIDPR